MQDDIKMYHTAIVSSNLILFTSVAICDEYLQCYCTVCCEKIIINKKIYCAD